MTEEIFNFFEVKTFEVPSVKILADDIRFNADYFLSSDNIVYNKNIKFTTLSEFAAVFFPGIFKRIIVDSPEFGVPFITTSGMMEYAPQPEKFLSIALTQNLPIYRVEEDWILVSRSGTIGNTVFTAKNLTRFAITEDALRVIPNDKNQVGFLYFYITSDYGKDLIVGKKGGAVVDHIYEDDLMRLQVPIVPDKIIIELQKKYLEVKILREEANDLLQEANRLVHEYNHLPQLNVSNAEYFDEEKKIPVRILNSNIIIGQYRLDGRFFNPLAELANKNIVNYSSSYAPLEKLVTDIVIGKRFKRNYVESEFGTPFIGSKNILQIRPGELKYLSNSETAFIKDLILEKNFILIACSGSLGGTFGKSCFIYKNFEGYAASQHILRIIPNDNKIDPAYLFAFLSGEYGYTEIVRYRYGSLIDEIDDENMKGVLIPICSPEQQKSIGDRVRLAYVKRAEAIHLENEGQGILKQSLIQ